MFLSCNLRLLLQISFFLSDYRSALQRAIAFDSKVAADAAEISTNYAAVVALSIRQAFAATEITISKAVDGSWNTTDVMVFLKGQASHPVFLRSVLMLFLRNIQQRRW
jgi:hypothetical protein